MGGKGGGGGGSMIRPEWVAWQQEQDRLAAEQAAASASTATTTTETDDAPVTEETTLDPNFTTEDGTVIDTSQSVVEEPSLTGADQGKSKGSGKLPPSKFTYGLGGDTSGLGDQLVAGLSPKRKKSSSTYTGQV
jgi:hypothetical protein